MHKWRQFGTVVTLPRSDRPAKVTLRAQRIIISEVKKDPRVSAEDLRKSLERANISVSTTTIKKTLNKNGIYRRRPRRKPLLRMRKSIWMLLSATGKTYCGLMKPKLNCLGGRHKIMSGGKLVQHTINKTSSPPSSMTVVASWCGGTLLPLGLDNRL